MTAKSIVYLDHAATSWPKPPRVVKAMSEFLEEQAGNPGRAGHRLAIEASRVVATTRELVARLFHVQDPLRVVFGGNATVAINLALRGLLRPGDHVVTTSIEHNAVMRPLRALEREGVELSVVPCSRQCFLQAADVAAALRPNTRLIAMNHASNVVGSVLPVADVGRVARRHGCLLLVDAAQSAGVWPIDVGEDLIDMLAFTGHKGLYGPMGTGGLVIGDRVDIDRLTPLCRGGTGSRSEEEEQPGFLPDRYESGTANAVGLAGLGAGVRWVLEHGVDGIREYEAKLVAQLTAGLQAVPGVVVYGGRDAGQQTPTVSFNVSGMPSSEVGLRLDEEFGILCRVGLHCAPAAHKTIGTFPAGTVRFGLGAQNTAAEVECALDAVRALAKEAA